jgi:dTMP kinase
VGGNRPVSIPNPKPPRCGWDGAGAFERRRAYRRETRCPLSGDPFHHRVCRRAYFLGGISRAHVPGFPSRKLPKAPPSGNGGFVSQRGTYVVVEGIDGTGKTELTTRLVSPLLARGHSISTFREPTDKFLRQQFQRLIRSDSLAAALCFTVDRAMLRPQVESALDQGDLVLQDRSYYATLAYQYPALGEEAWRELDRIERTLALEPDLILYLDASVEVAVNRTKGQEPPDVVADDAYLRRVKWKFEQMFQPPKWVRIDASRTPDRSLEQAMNALMAAGL